MLFGAVYASIMRFDQVLLIYKWTVFHTYAYMLLVGEVSSSIILRVHNNSTERDVKEIQVYKQKKLF
jgi:hypothetical protein